MKVVRAIVIARLHGRPGNFQRLRLLDPRFRWDDTLVHPCHYLMTLASVAPTT
jgi:hypothetical protein